KAYLNEVDAVISLRLAGIGENLDRTDFLKAWYVLRVRQGEAKTSEEKAEISRAVETLDFLKWHREYKSVLAEYGKKYHIDTKENGDPALKTKAMDVGLRTQEEDGTWTIKSIAQILLDDFIIKKGDGYRGLSINLLTNEESLEDVKELLKQTSPTGRSYEEELIDAGVLRRAFGAGNDSGIDIQRKHPVIQYDRNTGRLNFLPEEEALLNHGRHLSVEGPQMTASQDNERAYNIFSNTDNYEAGQFPSKIIGWMEADAEVGMAIVVTRKGTSEGNKKGGIATIVIDSIKGIIFKIIEIAQVKGNKELENKFQAAENSLFNTNIIVFKEHTIAAAIKEAEASLDNPDVIAKIIEAYPGLNSKEEILARLYVLGDLIANNKKTKDGQEYIKLEIAIASSVMELNNLISLATGKVLLRYVLLDEEEAQEMFGPIKNLQNFTLTLEGIKEADIRIKGKAIDIADYMINNASNVLTRTDKPLDKLTITGNAGVKLESVSLVEGGSVTIINNSVREAVISPETLKGFAMPYIDRRVELKNVVIIIDEDAKIFVNGKAAIEQSVKDILSKEGIYSEIPAGMLKRSVADVKARIAILKAFDKEITIKNLGDANISSILVGRGLKSVIRIISSLQSGSIENVREILGETTAAENAESMKMIVLPYSAAAEYKESVLERARAIGGVVVERAASKPRVNIADDGVVLKLRPNIRLKNTEAIEGDVLFEPFITVQNGTIVYSLYMKKSANTRDLSEERLNELYEMAAAQFAADINDNVKLKEKLGVSGVGMLALLKRDWDKIPEIRGVFVTNEESFLDLNNIEALNERIEAKALDLLDRAEKIVEDDIGSMSSSKAVIHINSTIKLAEPTCISLSVTEGKLFDKNGNVSKAAQDVLNAAHTQGVKINIVLDHASANFSVENAAKLLEAGFDAFTINTKSKPLSKEDIEKIQAVFDLPSRSIDARNIARVETAEDKKAASGLRNAIILAEEELASFGEDKTGYNGAIALLSKESKERIIVSNIESLAKIAVSNNASSQELTSALNNAGINSGKIKIHIQDMIKAKEYAKARGYLTALYELNILYLYLEAKEMSVESFRNSSNADQIAIRKLLSALSVSDDAKAAFIDKAALAEFVAANKAMLEASESATYTQLRDAANRFMRDEGLDAVTLKPIAGKEKIEQARAAVAVVDSGIIGLALDRLVENAKKGASISTNAIKDLLSAA
ncbi:MAG: hypothetical protein LBO62_07675, partial [Endomicrobium sp.]|nr:hypothetical protein [Endomicrobium sp.]